MAIYEFRPEGVCAQAMAVEVDDGVIREFQVLGGCSGNLQGISALIKGQKAEDVIDRLEGIKCGRKPTSCPDQLARGLRSILAQENAAE